MMRGRTRHLILCALLAALTAVGAFLRLPLGAMAITLQFLFTCYAGLLLGPLWGAASQAVYVLLGLLGLPIFTMGGGLGYVLQPSFGFLVGLIPAAAVAGALCGREGKAVRVFLACLCALAILYLVGIPYMYLIFNAYLGKGMDLFTVLKAGMLVYLPGDFLKLLAVSLTAPPLVRALARYRQA